jgi:hypothetical protein
MSIKKIFAACCCCAIFFACEESPLNGDIDNLPNLEIRGRIALSDAGNPEGIYVWMEDTPLSTVTNRDGDFVLALPSTASSNVLYSNGLFNLYFYIANYKLISTPVTVRNGKFLYSHGEVNDRGELINTLFMERLLNIATLVEPSVVTSEYSETIKVLVTLSAVRDSVEVVFPKMLGGELGAILFRDLDTGRIIADAPAIDSGTRVVKKIGNEPETFSSSFDLKRELLPVGRYEVIPYFFIEQANMPAGLLKSISQKAEEIGPDFLKIPFRRDGGLFAIQQAQ